MSDSTTIGAAYDESLSKSSYFNGLTVVAREAATYKHQNPRITGLATSSIVDKVLLSDGSEVWQCRLCGDSSWSTVLGAISHAGAHNRKPRVGKATGTRAIGAAAISGALDDAQRVVERTRHGSRQEVASDLRGVLRTLTAVKVQLGHMQDAIGAASTELTDFATNLTAGLSEAELEELRGEVVTLRAEVAELRDKAGKFDQMRGLFS